MAVIEGASVARGAAPSSDFAAIRETSTASSAFAA
jgi:hypothetical protein